MLGFTGVLHCMVLPLHIGSPAVSRADVQRAAARRETLRGASRGEGGRRSVGWSRGDGRRCHKITLTAPQVPWRGTG